MRIGKLCLFSRCLCKFLSFLEFLTDYRATTVILKNCEAKGQPMKEERKEYGVKKDKKRRKTEGLNNGFGALASVSALMAFWSGSIGYVAHKVVNTDAVILMCRLRPNFKPWQCLSWSTWGTYSTLKECVTKMAKAVIYLGWNAETVINRYTECSRLFILY